MRLLIIRHGDPDYEHDSLTEAGWKESRLLSEKLAKIPISYFYISTMGRARDTARATLEKAEISIPVYEADWLREFPCRINRPDKKDGNSIAWDWLPQDWCEVEDYFQKDDWYKTPIMENGKVREKYMEVTTELDKILAEHGYERNGKIYDAVNPNHEIIAFFCHFGLECVLLSHLMNVSPMILWHHTCAAPTSVTSLYTEERRKGKAVFRMNSFGDVSHLYAASEEPSFSARFCETWADVNDRHD